MKREDAVEARLGRILQRGDVPALGEHVRELTARLANPETTVRDIGPILRKDVGLAARVIRAANSAQFNRSGRPISSLSHGVALIGLEALRDMTVPLLMRQDSQPAAVRPVAGLAILTAAQARSAALHLHLAREDDAYLCGLFRGLGELLTAHFFPQDYARILWEGKDGRISEAVAAMRTMQCSFEDLGQAAARAWNLPPAVVATIHSEPLLGPALRSESDRLQAAVSFAHEVIGAIHRVSGRPQRDRLARILRIFGKPMGLRAEDIQRLAQEVADQTRTALASLALTPEALLIETQLAAAVSDADRIQEGVERQPESEPLAQPAQPEPLDRIEARIHGPGWQLEHGIVETLDLICQEGPFDQALFLLLSADHQELITRLSSSLAHTANAIRIPLVRSQGQAAAAVLARRDLFGHGGSLPTRDWPGAPPACFGVLPVVIDRIVAGAVYFERRQDPTPVSPPIAGRLAAARDLVGRMIAAQRALSHTSV
jgi:HD-like signal output (HDOD) protein